MKGNRPRRVRTRMELIEIGPEWCQAALEKNGRNFRRPAPHAVSLLMESITERGYVVDGNSIKFDSDGNLVDGAHRCMAIIRLGIKVKTWVCYNIEADGETVDTGRARKLGQALAAQGVPNAGTYGSAVSWFQAYCTGGVPDASVAVLWKTYRSDPDLAKSVRLCHPVRKICYAGMLSMVHYVASQCNAEEKANEFVSLLHTGANLKTDSSVYHLRERLLLMRRRRAALNQSEAIKLIVKAWNLFYRGTPCRALKADRKSETFIPPIEPLDASSSLAEPKKPVQ